MESPYLRRRLPVGGAPSEENEAANAGATPPTPTPAPAPATPSPPEARPPLTGLEKWLVGFFSFALFSNFTLDIVGNFLPIGMVTKDDLDTLIWPPYVIRTAWWWWVNEVDPILRYNQVYMWVICVFSPFLMAPFYVCGVYCILNRKPWILAPGLFWAGLLLSTLLPEMGEYWVNSQGMHWPHEWSELVFFIAYGSYFIIPAIMIFYFGRYPRNPKHQMKPVPANEKWMDIQAPTEFNKAFSPIWRRPMDFLLVTAMACGTLYALTLPYYTLLNPIGERITDEMVENLPWPPHFIATTFHEWSHYADPVWRQNPTWAYWYSLSFAAYPIFLIPFMWAFVQERQWLHIFHYEQQVNVRQIGLVWAGWHTSCLCVVLVGTFYEGYKLSEKLVLHEEGGYLSHPMFALLVYIPQLAYIVLLSVRLSPPYVFNHGNTKFSHFGEMGEMLDNFFSTLFVPLPAAPVVVPPSASRQSSNAGVNGH